MAEEARKWLKAHDDWMARFLGKSFSIPLSYVKYRIAEPAAEHIRRLLEQNEQLEADNARLRELIEYAGGILAHGTPGDAWMDWILRVQGQLGIEFHNARFENEKRIPLDRLKKRVKHMPRVYFRELKALEAGSE